MAAALELVRRELGRDAVILRTRQLTRRGLAGERPAGVEITAAPDIVPGELPRPAAASSAQEPNRDLAAWLRATELPEEIVAACLVHVRLAAPVGDEALDAELVRALAPRIPVAPAARERPNLIVALVGPPGSGKTTTIAKLAARARVQERQSVGLVSLDGYRAGAAEQLKAYANILDIPCVTAHGWEQLDDALERLAGLDRILIDTSSREAADDQRLQRLAGALTGRCALWLTLAADSRDSALERALNHFARIDYGGVIATRTDLLVGKGPIATIAARALAPLRFVTTGPSVGGDLEVAERDRIARWILASAPAPRAHRSEDGNNRARPESEARTGGWPRHPMSMAEAVGAGGGFTEDATKIGGFSVLP